MMQELEYAKDILANKYVHIDRVVSISKALISVTGILEDVTKQLFAEREANMVLAAEVDAYRQFIKDLGIDCRMTAPETDHLLNHYKAQGVDELIADRKSDWMVSYCEDAEDFAANLRAGRKG